MSVTPLMLSFVEDELSRTSPLIHRTVAATLSQLQHTPKTAQISSAQWRLQTEIVDALQRNSRLFVQVFADRLRVLVMADASARGKPAILDGTPQTTDFQLLDERRIDADVEISRAAQLIDLIAEWELRELQSFTSTLIGQTHVSTDSNPLRPSAYAQALWDATCAATPATEQRRFLFRTATESLAKQLKAAWAAASTRLESQGVEPSVYRTTVQAPSPTAAPDSARRPEPQTLGQLLLHMPAGRSGEAFPSEQSAVAASGLAATSGARFSASFEEVMQRIEALLRVHAQDKPQPAGSARIEPEPLHELAGSLLEHTSDAIDRQIVELWSRLFEAILCDDQLSAAVRAVMARLQVSALRVALTDSKMLDSDSHPVWRLMNRIAQAAQLWPQDSDPRAASLIAFSDSLAIEIAANEQPTAELYVHGLAQLEEHLAAQLQAQREAAQTVIDALVLTDRREILQRELSAQFSEQFRSTPTAPGVLAFMTKQWPRVVTESIVRFGTDSAQTAAYLQAANDLDVSLKLKISPQNRLQLFSLMPRLLKHLRSGMELIALPEHEQQAVLDDLMAAHSDLLGFAARSRAAPPATGVNPAAPDETDGPLEHSPQPSLSESLIDVQSMDTVPAELLNASDLAQTMPAELTEAIITAAPCQWFLRGRWQRVQLLWRSESARIFVFAGETAGCPHSITGESLRRLGREGLIKSLPETGLLQRALDRVGRKLANSR